MKNLAVIAVTLLYAGCGKLTTGKNSSAAETPSFVKVDLQLGGSDSTYSKRTSITAFTVVVSGCASGWGGEFSFEVSTSENLLNMKQGDSGCKMAVKKFSYKASTSTEFTAVGGTAIDTLATEGVEYTDAANSKSLTVELGSGLNSPLQHLEHVNFLVIPENGSLDSPPYISTTDVVYPGEAAPAVMLSRLTDYGLSSSTSRRDLEVVVECIEPLEFTMCGEQDVLDYRMRIIDNPATAPTQASLMTTMEQSTLRLQPTIAHVFANGFRYLAAMVPETTSTQEYMLIVQWKNSFRYFIFSPQNYD